MVIPMHEQYTDAMLEIENQPRGKDGKFSRHILRWTPKFGQVAKRESRS